MNSRGAMFAQAARGPILLITLGCLFALQQSDIVSFGKTWPALIIVIGLMKLFERLLLGPQPNVAMPGVPPPPYTPNAGWRGSEGPGTYRNTGGYQNPGPYQAPGTYTPPPSASTSAPPASGPAQEGTQS